MAGENNGRAEYDPVSGKVTIVKDHIRLELPGTFETLEDAKAAATTFVERLRASIGTAGTTSGTI